ncbi:MAG: hypothetical protein FJ100_13135 [Deltaproteobacteria bacterium]|nr:hypothetical protein [Deltaproteobacteria bacterium]
MAIAAESAYHRPAPALAPRYAVVSTLCRNCLCAVLLAFAVCGAACDRSCSKLADQLCERAELYREKNADELCERWRERTRRVGSETCQAALRTLERDRVLP